VFDSKYAEMAPRILNFNTKWRWVVSFMPRPIYAQKKKRLWYSLDKEAWRGRRCGDDRNLLPLLGFDLDSSANRFT
jgi:hypothetical protein